MTSLKQIDANRRNAIKSTGPNTEAGKDRSRRNAIRHGLTAETVIGQLEVAEDYRHFEAAVTTDFNPETAVERELVLRLASLLWRLRRAASIETGMFQNCSASMVESDHAKESAPKSVAGVVQIGSSSDPEGISRGPSKSETQLACDDMERAQSFPEAAVGTISVLARRFLHLAAEDKGAFARLGRYETALWRQVCQTIFILEVLRRQSLDMKWLPPSSHRRGSNSLSLLFPRG